MSRLCANPRLARSVSASSLRCHRAAEWARLTKPVSGVVAGRVHGQVRLHQHMRPAVQRFVLERLPVQLLEQGLVLRLHVREEDLRATRRARLHTARRISVAPMRPT